MIIHFDLSIDNQTLEFNHEWSTFAEYMRVVPDEQSSLVKLYF